MAALHEDMTADEAGVVRLAGNPVSPRIPALAIQLGGRFNRVIGRSRSDCLRRTLQDQTHACAYDRVGAGPF